MDSRILNVLKAGTVIPAHPLALDADRRLDERRQRGLSRYYIAAGAGGLAVGVHTTQFAIREPRIGLFEPVLRLAAEEDHFLGAGRDPGSQMGAVEVDLRRCRSTADLYLGLSAASRDNLRDSGDRERIIEFLKVDCGGCWCGCHTGGPLFDLH